jgi:D-aminopeptidase
VGKDLGSYYLKDAQDEYRPGGSIIVVIATDTPLSDRNLKRLARRAFNGIAATGSPMTNDSGDYAIAFSTRETVRRTRERREAVSTVEDLPNDQISPLFQAVMEGTEEAIYNAMLKATTMKGTEGRVRTELPLDRLKEILVRHGITAGTSAGSP